MEAAVWALATAIGFLVFIGVLYMADFSRLTAAFADIATGLDALAAAIRNPATDNNDQAQVDALAGQAEAAAEAIRGLTAEEDAEDAAS